MFTQPVSSPPAQMSVTTTATTPASPSRPSRLRGLSYLRNYTQNHLLSRDSHHNSSSSANSSNGRNSPGNRQGPTGISTGAPATAGTISNAGTATAANAAAAGDATAASNLTRSASYSPTSSGPQTTTNANDRLSLVSSESDPASAAVTPIAAAAFSQPGVADNKLINSGSAPSTVSNPAVGSLSTVDPAATSIAFNHEEPNMGRTRSATPRSGTPRSGTPRSGTPADGVSTNHQHHHNTSPSAAAAATGSSTTPVQNGPETAPSIRFSAYYDPRSTRPSLTFPTITRTLPTGIEKIRVGRYSERDSQSMAKAPGNQPSSAPVGFKSKVVSRRHCEFWYEDGKWYIKDVKSSSGTFLNHIRLSSPSQESKAFPVNDGDIVQLGIDFKGGEEMIFRCVKMRLELNRGWQTKLNTFNMAAHKRLQNMASAGSSASSSQECTICLGSIAPCQSLFVAPCSHTWHFKCVRSLLNSPQYPIFICPNCRAGADLEADVDEIEEEWRQLNAQNEPEQVQEQVHAPEQEQEQAHAVSNSELPSAQSEPQRMDTEDIAGQPIGTHVAIEPVQASNATTPERANVEDPDAMDVTVNVSPNDTPPRNTTNHPSLVRTVLSHTVSSPLPISNPTSGSGRALEVRDSRSPSPPNLAEGPITPRNDAGPWVLDGSAGRLRDASTGEMRSLDAAAADIEMSDCIGSEISSTSSLRVEHNV